METQADPPPAAPKDWRLRAGLAFVLFLVAAFVSGFFVDWDGVLAEVQARRAELSAAASQHPVVASLVYFAGYVLFTSLSIPGAVVISLVGGAIFGVVWAVLLISFASASGATFALLISRYLLRERIQAKYGAKLEAINHALEREGIFYLFALRLNPVVPYFLINVLFGLTQMPARQFWWVSQVGMLPATIIYVNAGAQIGQLSSVGGIIELPLLLSLVALSLFPIAARKLASWLRHGDSASRR